MFTCPTCQSTHPSYKAFHRHKTLKHPELIIPLAEQQLLRINKYNISPKLCKSCNQPLSYDNRNLQFCNHSCAAKYNNIHRDQNFIITTKNTWRNKLGSIYADDPTNHSRSYIRAPYIRKPKVVRNCLTCNTPFISKNVGHIYCHPTCNITKNGKIFYRILCKFNVNKKDHPTLFNSILITKYGWYTPSNKGIYNPTGLSWDHLYRIEDGFNNSIDPNIMSHPANAELVPWNINKSRKHSLITIDELYHRIHLWNTNQHNVIPYFFTD